MVVDGSEKSLEQKFPEAYEKAITDPNSYRELVAYFRLIDFSKVRAQGTHLIRSDHSYVRSLPVLFRVLMGDITVTEETTKHLGNITKRRVADVHGKS